MAIREEALYAPVAKFLTDQGYTVRGEVKHCDLAAIKGEELVVVELKTAFNLKLVYQIMERQQMTSQVYAAIPRPKNQKVKTFTNMIRLLKRLEVGLLTVALDSPLQTVDVVLTPADSGIRTNARKRAKVEKELDGRALDCNTGGITKRKILTAFKERSMELCCILEGEGKVPLERMRQFVADEKQIRLLSANYNGWYQRVEKGVYALSKKGKEVLEEPDFQEVVAFYRKKYEERRRELL